MDKNSIQLLDCTLRDGGYINNWKFGEKTALNIIKKLICANIDIVEIGFLRLEETNEDRTVWNSISDIPLDYLKKELDVKISLMVLYSKYDINLLPEAKQTQIDLLRVTFHDYDMNEGLEFCKQAIQKGYKVSCNPINIMGYDDYQLLELLEIVNEIKPYAFAIVDTFGSMDIRDLQHLVSICDKNLRSDITLGLHLHENKAQSFALAQTFANMYMNRNSIIDASLNGMGRVPGNLCIELIADYLNEYYFKNYEIDYLLEAIELYIQPIKNKSPWGYDPAYFLSAKYNLHRNYTEYLLKKGNLTHRDINHILSGIDRNKKAAYDELYIAEKYKEYALHEVDDACCRNKLGHKINGRKVVIIAPGESINNYSQMIKKIILDNNCLVIPINFVPKDFEGDYYFLTNSKRIDQYEFPKNKTIVTSNVEYGSEYIISYNSLCSTFSQGNNSLIMLMRLLKELNAERLYIAGADGLYENEMRYYDLQLHSYQLHDSKYNVEVASAIRKIDIDVDFITPSLYDRYE